MIGFKAALKSCLEERLFMKRALKAVHVAKSSETVSGYIQILFVILVVGGTIGITFLLKLAADEGPQLSAAPEQVVVDVIKPAETSHTSSRTLSGLVEARATVAISPEVTGRVISLHPQLLPGGRIGAGETLFSLDPTDYDIALERSRADVAAAEADLEQARADADNFIKDWKRVYPDKPAPALVAKEPQIKAIEARLAAAKANVRQAETNLTRTNVIAKNAVRIVESAVELGQLVGPNGQFGTYYVEDALRIRASAETSVVQGMGLAAGKTVDVSTKTGAPQPARIVSIGGALDERTRLQPIILSVPEGSDYTPGRFVTVMVKGPETKGVYRLPASAMATRSSVWRVSDGKLESFAIEIIDTTDDHVIVKAFDAKDGVVVSQVPTSFVARPVKIRAVVDGDLS